MLLDLPGHSCLLSLQYCATAFLRSAGNCEQAMILEQANTLDLTFFEDAEFYAKLRRRKAFPLLAPKKPG